MKTDLPGLIIRQMALKDLNPVYRLGLDEDIAALTTLEWDASSLAGVFSADSTLAFTAARKKEIAGFVIASVSGKTSELMWILVKTKFRNRGIGTALLNTITGALQQEGVSDFSIAVFPENNEIEKFFYKRIKMEKEGLVRLSAIL